MSRPTRAVLMVVAVLATAGLSACAALPPGLARTEAPADDGPPLWPGIEPCPNAPDTLALPPEFPGDLLSKLEFAPDCGGMYLNAQGQSGVYLEQYDSSEELVEKVGHALFSVGYQLYDEMLAEEETTDPGTATDPADGETGPADPVPDPADGETDPADQPAEPAEPAPDVVTMERFYLLLGDGLERGIVLQAIKRESGMAMAVNFWINDID